MGRLAVRRGPAHLARHASTLVHHIVRRRSRLFHPRGQPADRGSDPPSPRCVRRSGAPVPNRPTSRQWTDPTTRRRFDYRQHRRGGFGCATCPSWSSTGRCIDPECGPLHRRQSHLRFARSLLPGFLGPARGGPLLLRTVDMGVGGSDRRCPRHRRRRHPLAPARGDRTRCGRGGRCGSQCAPTRRFVPEQAPVDRSLRVGPIPHPPRLLYVDLGRYRPGRPSKRRWPKSSPQNRGSRSSRRAAKSSTALLSSIGSPRRGGAFMATCCRSSAPTAAC